MKTLMTVLLFSVASLGMAQKTSEQKRDRIEMTPEQRADIRAKELTLQLDLTASQQKEMTALFTENYSKRSEERKKLQANRESGKKLTADERYQAKSKHLDDKIAMNAKVKKILSDTQYQQWKESQQFKKERYKKQLKSRAEKQPGKRHSK